MSTGEKIARLRRENNYTQEQLADRLNVSRQAVSRWESDVAYPETDKIIKLAELFNCSVDYLLTDKGEVQKQPKFGLANLYFERKSKKTVNGLPLWHINIGIGRSAKGIIAIGFCARGVISVGLLSLGVLSFGLLSLGLIAAGAFSLGIIALGSISAGIIALGAICFGLLAIGAIAIGEFSVGALALGKYFALGDHAYALVAIGKTIAEGLVFSSNAVTALNRVEIIEALQANTPKIFYWLIAAIKPFL